MRVLHHERWAGESGLAEWRESPYNRFSRFSDLKPRPLPKPSSAIGDTASRYQFRTPSLRNVAVTAPYMHDGSVDTLFEAVRHHARTGLSGEPAIHSVATCDGIATLKSPPKIMALMPTTAPSAFSNGPPLLPGASRTSLRM